MRFCSGDTMQSPTWFLGVGEGAILLNKYVAGSALTVDYKTGNTEANCNADTWNSYNGTSFTCLGWVKVRITEP